MVVPVVKNLPAIAGDSRDTVSIPGSGRLPWSRNGNPLHYSCLGITWTEGSLQSMGSQRVRHYWACMYAHISLCIPPWFIIEIICYCSVAQLCPTLCHAMDCSTPCLPVPQRLPEFAQVHVHCISDAIQPSLPLMPPSPSAPNLSQHQGLFQWVVWNFSFSISPSSKYSGLISLKIDEFALPAVQGTLRSLESFPAPQFESINFLALCLLYGPALTTVRDHWEDLSLGYPDLCWWSNASAFQHTGKVCHRFPAKKHDFMAAVTFCSDFGAQKEEICYYFHLSPFYLPCSNGAGCHHLSFFNI